MSVMQEAHGKMSFLYSENNGMNKDPKAGISLMFS